MPSFDIVSEVNLQEVDNAVNTARKEVQHRYDLKDGNCEIQWDKKLIVLKANDEMKINAVRDILQSKLHKRGVEISSVKFEKVEPIGGMMLKQSGTIVQGIEKEKAKEIVKSIKDSKLKVQAQIMDELIRVTSKSIDELQATMSHVRGQRFQLPLQFTNQRS
ncbi:MAG TPA: YajQ family cyclic di-GMP-binding protein [Pseudobdellovibrionaceae bacterium]|nr:YajQ family cyclic di-GMP-binding protein [Pseudobdellovibrionaceae bacterium]